MNAKKAKALRKQVGFVPSAERLYTEIKHAGQWITQRVVTGPRHLYQQVKRGRVTL